MPTWSRWFYSIAPPELIAEVERHAHRGRALDLGCGTGANAVHLARLTQPDSAFRMVAFDRPTFRNRYGVTPEATGWHSRHTSRWMMPDPAQPGIGKAQRGTGSSGSE